LWCRIAKKGYRFGYMPEVLAKFRTHSEQKSTLMKRHHAEIIQVTKRYGSWIDVLSTQCHLKYVSLRTHLGKIKWTLLARK
jgi:hypothetical protein